MKEKINDNEFLREFRLNEKNIEKLAVKVDRKIDIVSKTSLIFDNNYVINVQKIREMLESMKEKYDVVLIDTDSDTKYKKLNQILVKLSTKVICLTEGNLIQVKKTKELLDEYIQDRLKIKIIYNKKGKYTLNPLIFKIIFLKFKIIGALSFDIKYNKIINKNVNKRSISRKIRKEYENIIDKLIQ